jgi:hypothetical protein
MENPKDPLNTKERIDSKIDSLKDQTNYTEEAAKTNRRLAILAVLISVFSLLVAIFKQCR